MKGGPQMRIHPTGYIRAILCALVLATTPISIASSALAVTTVDRNNAHLAIWKISGGGRAGTAFAVSDRHFVTCAHVLKGFVDRGIDDVFISQEGSDRVLRVNHAFAALTLTHDLAVFTTGEEVSHAFQIAPTFSPDRSKDLRVIAYPAGLFAVIDQIQRIIHLDRSSYTIPMDRVILGATSGAPVLNREGEVVAVLSASADKTNMAYGIRLEHLQGFIGGDIPFTACRDHATASACIDAAVEQTERMAEDGNPIAQYELGRDGYLNKDGDMDWLTRSAEQGFSAAERGLGFLAYEEERWQEAAKWLGRAADKGDPIATSKQAFLYYRGNGVAKDAGRAFELFRRSAISGDIRDQYSVGRLYERGVGVEASRELAIEWHKRAANKGHEKAKKRLEALSATGTAQAGSSAAPVTPDAVEASLALTREQRRQIQLGLTVLGFDPGPADGLFGRRTREAIRRWQAARGDEVTGYLDAEAVRTLLAAAQAATRRGAAS